MLSTSIPDLSEMKSSPVDALVIQSVAYLNRERVLKEEGLFRIPGDVTEIQRLYGRFRSGLFFGLKLI